MQHLSLMPISLLTTTQGREGRNITFALVKVDAGSSTEEKQITLASTKISNSLKLVTRSNYFRDVVKPRTEKTDKTVDTRSVNDH